MEIENDGLDGFEKDLNRRLHEHEVNRDQLLCETFNLAIANKAILETILMNQAIMFGHLFQDKTAEQHFDDFKGEFEVNQAKILAKALNELSKGQ